MKRTEINLHHSAITLGGEAGFDNARRTSGLKPSKIRELAESIATHGLINRILVWSPIDGDHAGKYIVIAGERRFRAISLLIDEGRFDAEAIPATVVVTTTDQMAELRALAFVDNVGREDLNGLEIAQELKRLADMGLKQARIAEMCGKSQAWVSLHLGVLKKATQEVQEAWRDNKITDIEAFALMKVDSSKQNKKLERVLEFREIGDKKAAADAAKTDDPMRLSRPGAATRATMLEDLRIARMNVAIDGASFMEGFVEALEWIEGQRPVTGIDNLDFYSALNPVVEARRRTEMAAQEAKLKAAREARAAKVAADNTAAVDDLFEEARP